MSFEAISNLIAGRVQLKPNRVKSLYGYALAAAPFLGEFWECGVFSGGSARMLAEIIRGEPVIDWRHHGHRYLRLFDTFSGFPSVSPQDGDYPKVGMFGNTSVESVQQFVDYGYAICYPGLIPETFAGLEESRIVFAHIDVDLYWPTKAALEFILPRMVEHGIVVVDDYGDPHYPGVAAAMNEFPINPEHLVVNDFGEYDHQAVIFI